MRPFTAILALCVALALSAGALAVPPGYEVRTFTGPGLTSYYPGATAPFTENTLKEPWGCPYCGYSTGGTWDTTGAAGPPWDTNGDSIPDEAETAGGTLGVCPDPWGTTNHPAGVPLVRANLVQRFVGYEWLGPLLTLVRGIPFRPGEVSPTAVGGPTNTISRVRVGFAFDSTNNIGLTGLFPGVSQVRFLLIPPGVSRPTARYHSLTWAPGATGPPAEPPAAGANQWGTALNPADVRIGVHPWRAIDGDVYHVRVRVMDPADSDLDIEVWSEANGLEYSTMMPSPSIGVGTALNIVCASGAVRLSFAPNTFTWFSDGNPADVDPPQWWAFDFIICNSARIIPTQMADAATRWDPNWISDPTTPIFGTPLPPAGTPPANYFVAQMVGGRGRVLDTDALPGGATLSDATAVQLRLRPGETGTGMVAVLWRNSVLNMWSYDEDTMPAGPSTMPEAPHPNGIQPIAARFFCSRVDTGNPTIDLPPGAPGGATEMGAGPGGSLTISNRQIGEVIRCPLHVQNLTGRSSGDPVDPWIDPWWVGSTIVANGDVVGVGPGGDTPFDPGGAPIAQMGDPLSPTRTIGCGAVHVIDGTTPFCWCGRMHAPAIVATMYCNYCGTKLLGFGATVDDLERATARVDIDAPQATASRATVFDAIRNDAVYSLAAESVRGTKDGVIAPGATYNSGGAASTPRSVTTPLFASLPAFQLSSYAPGVGGLFTNGAPQPYQGAFLAYRTADEDGVWYENPLTGAHTRLANLLPAMPRRAVCDGNGRWDILYRCPDCGNKHLAMAFTTGTGSAPYVYTDSWTTVGWATELECSYGRNVGAAAPNTAALECPGHQLCPTCGCSWEVQGEGESGIEMSNMTLTVCPFDATTLVTPGTLQTRMTPDNLTAEEFDPIVVQANVMRKARLTADRQTVNLGRVLRAWNTSVGSTVEVTPISRVALTNESNLTLPRDPLLTQGVTSAALTAPDNRSVTTSMIETPALTRADADPTPENRSAQRNVRALPITVSRVYAARPSSFPAAGDWARLFAPGVAGSAGGQAVHALMRGGTQLELPIPIGEGAGNYSGSAMAFVDTNANGGLDFLDRSMGLQATTSLATPFDATEDYALEPVIPLTLRMRVAEARIPGNDLVASDASPAPLFVDTNGDGLHDRLDLVWESNRPGATPNSAVNLYEAATGLAEMRLAGGGSTTPGIARDYIWNPDATGNPWLQPVTADGLPGTVNGSPEVYIDPVASRRWLLWHKLTPTDAGVASTLWSASASGDMSDSFQAAGTANYIFDSSLDKSWIRGFINPNATAPANHWSFWNSGKRGKEEVHFCYGTPPTGQTPETWGYDPQDPNTVSDEILPVSNGVPPSAKRDWVDLDGSGTWIRRPPKSPFTYAKDPAPVMEMDPATGRWTLHTFFTGFVPQEGNSDICYAAFRMADLANADANYGKLPHARIEGPLGGEELRADGPRQTFGARHLDWVTTRRRPNEPADRDFMRAVAPVDPQFFIHLVTPSATGSTHVVYQVTWAQEALATDPLPHRYNRAEGVYRLGGLTFTQISPPGGTITPVEPRTGRPLELYVDPAAGLVRFSVPLFNPSDPADPATFFNSTNFAGLDDVALWANYTPFVYRICRDDANDDSPSAFFDYGDPTLASPIATPAQRASLGRFAIFWRRSHGASEPPHFGRTSFMYRTFSTAIQVGQPPIAALTTVTDVSGAAPVPVPPIGVDTAAGIVGLPAAAGGAGLAGHRLEVVYDSVPAGTGVVEYHTLPGWSEEKRVNVDTVYAEGPLLVKREWYAVSVTDVAGTMANQYIPRYWLFWTSPRGRYEPTFDQNTGALLRGDFYQSRDVYYATVVPEYGTSVTDFTLPSR
ncbi:MAG: hypothetical protein FJX75_03035 [Armatimonadetes bacterium]|nr:hypothetical protein [Armatimonadota bacterium]